MDDLLKQLGITREEIIDRITSKALGLAADQVQGEDGEWQDVAFCQVAEKKIEEAIKNLIKNLQPTIQQKIDQLVTARTEEIFLKPFQPVNEWGEKQGEPTTIKDMISKEAIKFWECAVDDNGDVTKYGSGKQTRAAYYAKKVTRDYYSQELTHEIKKMALEIKNKIPATIADEIREAIFKYLKDK